jgi:hypothetical protein
MMNPNERRVNAQGMPIFFGVIGAESADSVVKFFGSHDHWNSRIVNVRVICSDSAAFVRVEQIWQVMCDQGQVHWQVHSPQS